MKHEIISKQRETFFVIKWFFSERFLSKFLEDDKLKSVFWDFWEYYWEFWESNSTQPPHKWTLRIFLDKCAEALSQLQVGQNRDFCQISAVFLHPRNLHNAKKAWKTELWEKNFFPSLSPSQMINLHWSFRWGYGEVFLSNCCFKKRCVDSFPPPRC